jgi:hypothetical protein
VTLLECVLQYPLQNSATSYIFFCLIWLGCPNNRPWGGVGSPSGCALSSRDLSPSTRRCCSFRFACKAAQNVTNISSQL